MAEHLTPSDDFSAIVDDFVRRLRAVEREGRLNDLDINLLQTFENGQLLGDTRFINFGAGVRATLTGDRYVEVTAAGGGGDYLDAIVDFDGFASSDTSAVPPEFVGIAEALDYLQGIGMENVVVGVRGSNTTYTETANWTPPANVRLVAVRAGGDLLRNDALQVEWVWNGFVPSVQGNMQIENFANFEPHAFNATVVQLFSTLHIVNTELSLEARTGTVFLCDDFQAEASIVETTSNAVTVRIASTNAMFYDTDILTNVSLSGSFTFIPAGTTLLMQSCRWACTSSSGNVTTTLPAIFDIDMNDAPRRVTATTPGSFIVLTVPSSGAGRIRVATSTDDPHFKVNATSAFDSLDIGGNGVAVGTISGAHDQLSIRSHNNTSSHAQDITGPATLDMHASGTAKFIFRGEGIGGTITADGLTGSTTFLDFIACDRAGLIVAADPTGSTRKSYAFDASSDRNVLVFHGLDSGWVAGTDAGTLNRVLPEGATPFSGISGHVIEDEGTPLTQRANLNFVGAGVTVTDSAPDTIVTIPGGGAGGGDLLVAWIGL